MIQLIWLAVLVYLGFRIASSLKPPLRQHERNGARNSAPICAVHQDPVCGVYVSEEEALITVHNGQTTYFCSRACLDKFQQPD